MGDAAHDSARRRPGVRRPLQGCALVLALALAACAGPAPLPADLQVLPPIVLLGEVHDNAAQHRLRLQVLESMLSRGARPALAMEQFDRERQPLIDRLQAQTPSAGADALIAAAGGPGWNWAFYRPYVALALLHGLPIIAANVSRDDARAVMRQGLAAAGFDAEVPGFVLNPLANALLASHCGAIDSTQARRMALAQVARDQFMAQVVAAHAARGVVLLAGNGHVRTDVGAPHWLSPADRSRSVAIGVLEAGDDSTAYDRRVFTAPQDRPDPCAGMKPRS